MKGRVLRAHAALAVKKMQARAWLVLVPAARAVLGVVLPALRPAAPIDWAPLVLACAWAVLQWRAVRYRLSDAPACVTVQQGVLVRRTLHLAMRDAATVTGETSPLLRFLGAGRVRLGTAGLRRKSDATLYLPHADLRRLMGSEKGAAVYRAKRWPILLLALSGSNAAVGMLTAVPLLRRIGALSGVEGWAAHPYLPPLPALITAAGNLLLAGWGFSFIKTLLGSYGFCAYKQGDRVRLCSGWMTRRTVLIDARRITALELRQTLFMRLFGVQSAGITAAGYGREQGVRPVLIPAAAKRQLGAALDGLLGDFPICRSLLRPARGEALRYLWLPLLLCPLGTLWLLVPQMGGVLCLLWCGVCGWWLAVRFLGYRSAGLGIGERAVSLRCYRGLALFEIHIPIEVVDAVVLTQSPRQRKKSICTVTVRCFGEKRRRYRVPALPFAPIEERLAKRR